MKKTVRGSAVALLLWMMAPAGHVLSMDFIYKDNQYSFQTLRTIAATAVGSADIGECLMTAYRIKEGDDEGWYREWKKTAEQLEKAADQALSSGHRISAMQKYFRASNYYRTAEFFLRSQPYDPRAIGTWRKSRENFLKGAKLSETPIRPVEIPFEGTTLPGYYCLVDRKKVKRPLLIIQTGFDGTGEEVYFQVATYALKRGYNCLVFEGPGQGRVIREQKIPFRHNWETVVTPVVDFALRQKEVHRGKIALMGISFGGYLAPRAVAYEHRIKACIANGGVYDFHDTARLTPDMEKAIDNREGAEEMDKEIYHMIKKNPSLRWAIGNGLFTFQAKTPSEWFRMTRLYTMKDEAGKIRCPMLIVDSEDDKDMPGQARRLYDALKSPRTFMMFTKAEGAEEHCQIGAYATSGERILDWLDDTMKRIK